MRLYKVTNTKSSRLILSQNKETCLKFAMRNRVAKLVANLSFEDITDTYIQWHKDRGCTKQHLNTLSEGFFIQIIKDGKSKFKTTG